MAATNKYLAQNNKSRHMSRPTKDEATLAIASAGDVGAAGLGRQCLRRFRHRCVPRLILGAAGCPAAQSFHKAHETRPGFAALMDRIEGNGVRIR